MVYATFIESNKRMLSGIALSFFVHAMVLSLAAGFSLPKEKLLARHELDVYLPVVQPENKSPSEKMLLSRAVSTYRVSGKSHSVQPAEVVPEVSASEVRVEPAPQGSLIGFSLPRAIGLPWLPPEVSVRPVQQHARPIDAYRAMHEAEQMAAQKLAMRAQMVDALMAALEKESLEANGHCSVSQSTESFTLQLACDSPLLEKMLREKMLREKHLDALASLVGMSGEARAVELVFGGGKVVVSRASK